MRLFATALFLILGGGASALAQNHMGKDSYINLHGQTLAMGAGLGGSRFATGVSIDWGAFQNRYIATGTRFGFSRYASLGGALVESASLEFGGGPQFHIPVGPSLLIIPSVNLGYRLSSQLAGMGVNVGLAVAWRFKSVYAGAEFDAPLWQQYARDFFPGPNTINALVGFYY